MFFHLGASTASFMANLIDKRLIRVTLAGVTEDKNWIFPVNDTSQSSDQLNSKSFKHAGQSGCPSIHYSFR